jgi:lysophospholipase L1-like esterase
VPPGAGNENPSLGVLRRHPRLATAALALASVAFTLALVEIGLRLAGYRFSPIVFVRAEGVDDHRPFHMGAVDPRVSEADPLTIADPDLLWRPNPGVSAELSSEGYRGDPVPPRRAPEELLLVALGDSNTLGPLNTADHWPGMLQDALRANESRWRFQVLNAGVYGYTSFQGLRRFRQVAAHRPDIAYFSFGGNDAQPVRTPDALYAARVGAVRRWHALRLAPPLFHLTWRGIDALGGEAPLTPRVPLADYRRHLESFVDEAGALGIVPVLLTRPFVGASDDPRTWLHHAPAYNRVVREVAEARGVPFLDAHALLAAHPERFTDAMHADRVGHRLLAEALASQLHGYGLLDTDGRRDLASALDLMAADERRAELGPGLWLREARPDGPGGRWTDAEAVVTLGRPRGERTLLLDLTCRNPRGETRGRVEADGRTLAELPRANGRHRLWLDLGEPQRESVALRIVVDSAYRPREVEPGATDARRVGVFLHAARLLESPWPDALDLGVADDGHPALGGGFWARETWPDGAGRWTKGEAAWRMFAPEHARVLWLDLRFQSPWGRTRGAVLVDGRTAGSIDEPNGRRLLHFAVPGVAGRAVEVRLQVRPFRPRTQDPASGDDRELGLVLHAAWLGSGPPAPDADPLYAPRVLLAEARDGSPELWSFWTLDKERGGRSPTPGAALRLQRTGGERWLEIDYSTEAPLTSGRFEVDGEMLHGFRRARGRAQVVLDVSRFAGRVLTVRAPVDFPRGDGSSLVIHEVALKP